MATTSFNYTSALPRRTRTPLVSHILRLFALNEQRHRLAELDDAMLKDIGLTRGQAEAEARRPVWDVPANWKC